MQATAISKVTKSIRSAINNKFDGLKLNLPCLPRRVRSKCPAIILAAKRTASVAGRIIDLIVSINTIIGISPVGVPKGTRCAAILLNW